MSSYLTDGVHLYRVVRAHEAQNYGLLSGVLSNVIVEDCLTEDVRAMQDLEIATCSHVEALEPVLSAARAL